jgi:thiosulfate/3-mercaptopyruvate sulfurtransferase
MPTPASENMSEQQPYPTDLLIEATEVAKAEVAHHFRVLDTRPRSVYLSRHIPGAVWIDINGWANAFGANPDPSDWEKKIGALGISLDTPVIIYDRGPSKDAAHLWWILRYWGVRDVRLLNGGWGAWLFAALPQSNVEVHAQAQPIQLRPDPARWAQKDQVLKVVQTRRGQILDARSELDFSGNGDTARRNGAVPTAKNLNWATSIDWQTWRFKSPEKLTEQFHAAGIDLTQPTITYCNSGDEAALMAFTLELMGAKNVRNYYRGWEEWGNADDTPVVTHAK